MLLAIDVGNTATGIAVFDGDKILSKNRLLTPSFINVDFLKSLLKKEYRSRISQIIVSSVVPLVDSSLKESAEAFFRQEVVFVDHNTDTGLTLKIDDPSELGADRIADSIGALLFYPPPLIVIDSGTAITFDIVSENYEYLGGSIFPGIELSINSLASNTAKLERIHFSIPKSIIGTNTDTSIRAGIYFNYVGGISYMIDQYKKIIGANAKVVATGGLSRYFEKSIKNIDKFEPDLIYYGLKKINDRLRQL
jgi:type III pantothenate kinase